MRQYFAYILLFFALLSCEGPMGPEGPAGAGMNWDVKEYTVQSSQWVLNGAVENQPNSFYFYEIIDPDLSEFIAEEGNVFVYLFTSQTSTGSWVQTPLPYILHKSNDDGTERWTETYDYDFTTGSIVIYVTYNDFFTETRPPSCTFRVVKNW